MPSRDDSFSNGGLTWLAQMRQRFEVAIEVLDVNLECVLPAASSGPVGATLRAAVLDRREAIVREAALAALDSGTARSVSVYGLRIRAVPLQTADAPAPSGLLIVADRLPDPQVWAGAQIAVDQRLETTCHWLAPAVEATLDTVKTSVAQAQSADRLAGIVDVVSVLPQLENEDDIIQMLMDAAGLWHGADVRVYRQDVTGSFVLDACVPGFDFRRMPSRLAGSLLDGRDHVFRIASVEEAEALGWDRPPDETVFVPIAVHDATDWVIAVSGADVASLTPALACLRQILGLMLENLEARTRARLQQQLASVLSSYDAPFESAARIGLEVLASEVSASSIHLWIADGLLRIPAVAVEWRSTEPEEATPPDAAIQETHVFDRSSGVTVALMLRRRGRALAAGASRLAQAVVDLYGLWISGILMSRVDLQKDAGDAGMSALVGRLKGQLDSAGCLKIGGAVAVMLPQPSPPTGPQLDEAMQVLQDHVRSSDIIGLVEPFGAGVLLPNASESVASALVGRLEGAAREHGLGAARIGAATFAPFSEVPEALLTRVSARAKSVDRSGPART